MITVYTLTYNEELLMQFMIDHYRSKFPNCHIVIYDNSSTDDTLKICKANNCEIRTYNSDGTLNDRLHMDIKNECWKDAKTDWVLICDLDELLDINQQDLENESCINTTIIKSTGYDMVNMEDNYDFKDMKYGCRHTGYDKCALFNKNHITNINYSVGCHDCKPTGNVQFNKTKYLMLHYKLIHSDLVISRYKETFERLSEENIKHNWGWHCKNTAQQWLDYFTERRSVAVKIL